MQDAKYFIQSFNPKLMGKKKVKKFRWTYAELALNNQTEGHNVDGKKKEVI